jgi:hypothetical protein
LHDFYTFYISISNCLVFILIKLFSHYTILMWMCSHEYNIINLNYYLYLRKKTHCTNSYCNVVLSIRGEEEHVNTSVVTDKIFNEFSSKTNWQRFSSIFSIKDEITEKVHQWIFVPSPFKVLQITCHPSIQWMNNWRNEKLLP